MPAKPAVKPSIVVKPHPLQLEVLNSRARFRGMLCGRRVGKSYLLATLSMYHLLSRPNANILYGTSKSIQTHAYWRTLTTMLRPMIQTGVIRITASPKRMYYGNSELLAHTASEGDTLRGDGLTLLLLDEANYIPAQSWDALLPSIADSGGRVLLATTPLAGAWVNMAYLEYQQSQNPLWAWWNMPSHANPYLDPDELELLKANMTDAAYREEILAEVLAGMGGVFTRINEAAINSPLSKPAPNRRYVFGIDWGEQQDFTVVVVMDMGSREMVHIARFNRMGWDAQRQRIQALYETWKPTIIISEASSGGVVLNQDLAALGLPIYAFNTTGISKPQIVNSLALAFDKAEIKVLNDPVLTSELMTFQAFRTQAGNVQYRATAGAHDDCVMALAFAWYGVLQYANTARISFF